MMTVVPEDFSKGTIKILSTSATIKVASCCDQVKNPDPYTNPVIALRGLVFLHVAKAKSTYFLQNLFCIHFKQPQVKNTSVHMKESPGE